MLIKIMEIGNLPLSSKLMANRVHCAGDEWVIDMIE